MWRGKKKNRRGIAPIVATLILIAITVASATTVYELIKKITMGLAGDTKPEKQTN